MRTDTPHFGVRTITPPDAIDKKNGRNKFGEAGPTEGWWNGFKKRNPESVKLSKPDSLDRGRALCATADNL